MKQKQVELATRTTQIGLNGMGVLSLLACSSPRSSSNVRVIYIQLDVDQASLPRGYQQQPGQGSFLIHTCILVGKLQYVFAVINEWQAHLGMVLVFISYSSE